MQGPSRRQNFTCQVGEAMQDAVGKWVNGGHGKSMTFQMDSAPQGGFKDFSFKCWCDPVNM